MPRSPQAHAHLINFDAESIAMIIAAGHRLQPKFSEIVDQFYDAMMKHEFLQNIVAKYTTTDRLKATFCKYIEQLFSGSFNDQYAQNRIKVGMTHNTVGLPLTWYLGMFPQLQQIIFKFLEPLYEHRPLSDWIILQTAICNIMHYDQLLAVNAYVDSFTSKLRAETLEADHARRAKSLFLATVSHELRTPLSSIIGYTDLILDTASELKPETKQHLSVLHRNAENLLAMINGLIDIGRADSGRWESTVTQGKILDLMDDMAICAEGLVAGKTIQIVKAYKDRASPLVEFDFSKLRQMTLNIVSNACKFTQEGEIILDFIQGPATLSITVADTGAGIPESEREKIFQEFYRIPSTRRQTQGSGLGLPLVKTLVDSFGGSISVSDHLPHGSTFTIVIPLS